MDRKEWQDKRRDSAKTRGENWLRQNAINIAERTLGEEFYQLALANNMSLRYQQSLKVTIDGLTLTLELDYDDVETKEIPLGFKMANHFFLKDMKSVEYSLNGLCVIWLKILCHNLNKK